MKKKKVTKNQTESEKLIDIIVSAAKDKKANNPVVLDISKLQKFADYMIIVSGDAVPHLKAIMREIDLKVKQHGVKGIVWEGTHDCGWLIFDLGSILVHIMGETERAYYNLEELWGKEATVYHE